jgi:predicted DNA-binding protein (UPF0251 family)
VSDALLAIARVVQQLADASAIGPAAVRVGSLAAAASPLAELEALRVERGEQRAQLGLAQRVRRQQLALPLVQRLLRLRRRAHAQLCLRLGGGERLSARRGCLLRLRRALAR